MGKKEAAGGGGDARRKGVYLWRGGAASLRGADTAKVCSSAGHVSFDGDFECSFAVPGTQGVSIQFITHTRMPA